MRLLLIEDDAALQITLHRALERKGIRVELCADGGLALARWRAVAPDVVVLDLSLPGLDGLEVAKQIRQQPALKHIMLVAMTGYGHERDRQRSRQAGFDHHLVKPADFDELQKLLATVAERAT